MSNRYKLVSAIDKQEMQKLVDQGKTYSDIARLYGVSSQSVSEIAQKYGVVLPPNAYQLLVDNQLMVINMFLDGKNARHIASHFSVGVDSVRRFLRINKIKKPIECPFDVNLFDQYESWQDLANFAGVNRGTVVRWANKLGKQIPSETKKQTCEKLVPELWKQGYSTTDVASKLQVSQPYVSAVLKKQGINPHQRNLLSIEATKILSDYDKLFDLRQKYSLNEIAQQLNCHPDTVTKKSQALGIRYKSPIENIPELSDKVILGELYQKYSLEKIADILGCSHPVISQQINALGITRKSKFISSHESMICQWLDENQIRYQQNNRSILDNNRELDIIIPSRNIAFEINGCYWHSELFKDKNYHLNKKHEASLNGYRLIHFFEDEINNKPQLIKRKIVSLFEKPKIFARMCKVIFDVPYVDFLNENHIQGSVSHSYNIGLQYDEKLVAICCFKKDKDTFNLVRYATSELGVVGGFSKIISNVKHGFYTYADMTWTDYRNNMYEKSGLKYVHTTPPDYSYYDRSSKSRISRRLMTRENMVRRFGDRFDPNLTEHENAKNLGFLKIFDCGKIKYIKEE